MEHSNFSETQFVIAHLRELLDRPKSFWLDNFLRMPSTSTEKHTGADAILGNKKTKGSYFLQYKRSDHLHSRRGLRIPQKSIDKGFFPCYRFKVYNSSRTAQFDTLRSLARRKENYCAYVAPLFHTFEEFDSFFSSQTIMQNSVVIELGQFNTGSLASLNVVQGELHHLLFNRQDQHGIFCSDPIEIKKKSGASFRESLIGAQTTSFEEEVKLVASYLLSEEILSSDILQTDLSEISASIMQQLLFQRNILWIPNFIN